MSGFWRCPLIAVLTAALLPSAAMARGVPPIIDMHLHARRSDYAGANPPPLCAPFAVMPRWDPAQPDIAFNIDPPCPNPIFAGKTTEGIMRDTLTVMERYNIIGMVSGDPDLMAVWKAAAPGRIIAGLDLRFIRGSIGQPVWTPDEVRARYKAGDFQVLGEVMAQYDGLAPDDARLEPYWAIAEELDIPVGIHMGPGGPGDPYFGAPGFRARNSSAFGIEEVLVRHPKLRVYLMHAGYPLRDDTKAVLFAHPQLYVDIASIVYTEPRPAFYAFLKDLVEAGYGDRIMFGSDQMIWPGVIEPSIKVIQDAPFLNARQRRDIFYNNAARFLRLTKADIDRHWAMGRQAH